MKSKQPSHRRGNERLGPQYPRSEIHRLKTMFFQQLDFKGDKPAFRAHGKGHRASNRARAWGDGDGMSHESAAALYQARHLVLHKRPETPPEMQHGHRRVAGLFQPEHRSE